MVEKFDDITPPDTLVTLANEVSAMRKEVRDLHDVVQHAIRPYVTPWYQRAAIVGGAVALILIAAEMLYYAPVALAGR